MSHASNNEVRLLRRKLGRTGLELSVVGLGTAAIGSDPAGDEDGTAAIERAVELGINWIDTAPVYGGGRTEHLLGTALRRMPSRPLLFGKTAMTVADGQIVHSLDRTTLRRDLDASLLRLGVDELDVLFVHWPIPDAQLEEGWAALAELRTEGKVRFLGASNFSIDQLRRAMGIDRVDVVQARYSLVHTAVEEEILPYCTHNGIGYLAYAAMGGGLFAGAITRARLREMEGDHRANLAAFTEPALTRNLELYAHVAGIAASRGVDPGAVAVAWVLQNPQVSSAIVGLRRPAWVERLVRAVGTLVLTPGELSSIDEWMHRDPEASSTVLDDTSVTGNEEDADDES